MYIQTRGMKAMQEGARACPRTSAVVVRTKKATELASRRTNADRAATGIRTKNCHKPVKTASDGSKRIKPKERDRRVVSFFFISSGMFRLGLVGTVLSDWGAGLSLRVCPKLRLCGAWLGRCFRRSWRSSYGSILANRKRLRRQWPRGPLQADRGQGPWSR